MLQLNKVNICEKAVADEKMGSFVMDGYFYVLTTIDLFVLCFMCILTHLSESLSEKQKRGFSAGLCSIWNGILRECG